MKAQLMRCWRCQVQHAVVPTGRYRWVIAQDAGRIHIEIRLCWVCARWFDGLVRAEKIRAAQEMDAVTMLQ